MVTLLDLQYGNTALIMSAHRGRDSIVEALLANGAKKDARSHVLPNIDPKGGGTALIAAAWKGHEGCVRLLLEAGANRSIKEIDGNTALDVASTEAIKAILRS